MKIFYKILFLLLTFNILKAQKKPELKEQHLALELPATGTADTIIHHLAYSLLYNEQHEQAAWVAFELTKEETYKTVSRSDKFISDPAIKTGSTIDDDYKKSGYDRGHLAPAADMGWADTIMKESFFFSNMSPQNPGFNRGIWKKLEELERTWAYQYKKVFITVGPVLKDGLPQIGKNGVSVPESYFKAIMRIDTTGVYGIGFIIPNKASNESPKMYAMSIDSIEKVTAFDLFPSLNDSLEQIVEAKPCTKCWLWKAMKQEQFVFNTEIKFEQCLHRNETGIQCTNKSENGNFCKQHKSINSTTDPATNNSVTLQCSALTKSGKRCKNKTNDPSGKCYVHKGK